MRKEVMSTRRVCGPAQAWPRLLRSQGASPVPAGGPERLGDVLVNLYMGFGRAECSNAGVVDKTHEHKFFESREPGEVPHWVKKDSISTLMDLHEKMACVSGILADVTLNPNL